MKLTVAAPETGLKPSPKTATSSPVAPRTDERPVTVGWIRVMLATGSTSPPSAAVTEAARLLTSVAVWPVTGPA
ncbi:hypothetical protein D3C86_1363920 [compost metagenome]